MQSAAAIYGNWAYWTLLVGPFFWGYLARLLCKRGLGPGLTNRLFSAQVGGFSGLFAVVIVGLLLTMGLMIEEKSLAFLLVWPLAVLVLVFLFWPVTVSALFFMACRQADLAKPPPRPDHLTTTVKLSSVALTTAAIATWPYVLGWTLGALG